MNRKITEIAIFMCFDYRVARNIDHFAKRQSLQQSKCQVKLRQMIKLRDFHKRDIASLATHANNLNVSRYLTSRMPSPYTEDDAKWWVQTGCREQGLNLAIDLKGECIGVVGVRFGKSEFRYSAEIGYWLAEAFWGKGIATTAVSKMTEMIFSEKNIIRLYAPVFSPNKPSMRVLEKCGYTLEAVHQKAVFKNDEFMDEHIYVKFRS